MATCIQRWIQKRLGIMLQLDPESAGQQLFDGQLYYKLLKSYNYATECKPIRKAKDPLAALQNLRELCIWFRMLDVPHDDILLRNIANKDGSQALRLLYDLLVSLENKHKSFIISRSRVAQITKDIPDSFSIHPSSIPARWHEQTVRQTQEQKVEVDDPCQQLSLAEQMDIERLFKEHQDRIRQNCILKSFSRRKKAKKHLDIKIETIDKKPLIETTKPDIIDDQLGISLETDDKVLKLGPEEYVNLLKLWRRKAHVNEIRNKGTQSKLLQALWEHMIKSQVYEFHDAFCEKLLKQSNFEKNLASRLNIIHNNYYTFRENSESIRNQMEFKESEIDKFEDTYQILNQRNEEIYEEKKRVYELHRILYDAKIKKKHEQIVGMCQETVEDLLTFSFNQIHFKELYNEETPKKLTNQWKEFFYKGIMDNKAEVMNLALGFDKLLNKDSTTKSGLSKLSLRDNSEITSEKSDEKKVEFDEEILERSESINPEFIEFLNELHLQNYLYLTGPWFVEMLLPNYSEEEDPTLWITGFIIHRLLETKYPFPPPPPKADLPNYERKIIITPFNDTQAINKLKGMLNNKGLAVIEIPSVINFCTNVYKQEKTLSNIGISLKEKTEDFKKYKDHKKKLKKEVLKKGKDKYQTKKEIEKDAVPKNRKDKGKKDSKIQTEDKEIQVPSEEVLIQIEGHSRAALLGKLAFEVLNSGKKLSDIHIVNMLIEYIRSLEGINGWIILNYPLAFSQAAFLEYLLGGIQVYVPRQLLDENELENVGKPFIDVNMFTAFEEKLELLRIQGLKPYKTDKYDYFGEEEEQYGEEIEEEELTEYQSLEEKIEKNRTIKELKVLRTSRILPRPNKATFVPEIQSYFTKYINLHKYKLSPEHNYSFIKQSYETDGSDPYSYYYHVGISERIPYVKLDSNILKILNVMIFGEEPKTPDDETQSRMSPSPSVTTLLIEESERSELTSTEKSISDLITDTTTTPSVKSFLDLTYQLVENTRLINVNDEKIIIQINLKPETAKKFPRDKLKYKHIIGLLDKEERLQLLEQLENHWGNMMVLEEIEEAQEEEEEVIIYPGDSDWVYSELPVSETLQKTLATVWETVESTYLENLKNMFILFKQLDGMIIPYKLYVRQICEECINLQDNKQTVITNFQVMFNEIEDELRSHDEMKCELHCRVYELFNELNELTDQKKHQADLKRRELIEHNWVAHHLYSIVNIAINIIQIEMDRFIDTLQILHDYHIGSLQKVPNERKFEKIIIEKMKYPVHSASGNITHDLSGGSSADIRASVLERTGSKKRMKQYKLRKVSKDRSKGSMLNSVPFGIELILLNEDLNHLPNPSHILITHCIEDVMNAIKNVKSYFDNIIRNEYNNLLSVQILSQKLEEELKEDAERSLEHKQSIRIKDSFLDNVELEKKWKEKNRKTIQETSMPKVVRISPIFGSPTIEKKKTRSSTGKLTDIDFIGKQLADPYNRLLWEWSKAVEQETKRILFRIRLIEARTKYDMDELLSIMKEVFQEFTKEISTNFHKEIKNIHLVTNLFKAAIEENQYIKPLIILDKDNFYIKHGILLRTDAIPPPPTPLCEPSSDFVLSIEQATNIMDRLNYAAPDGIIEESLVTILEDMAIFGSECGKPFLPKGWQFLTNLDFRQLISKVFREMAMIDWRDFLLMSLNLQYPTFDELLDVRQKLINFDTEGYETINLENFKQVEFWFEKNIEESLEEELRIALLKEFLFKLYSVNRNETNYAAMLMAFCRDEHQFDGFIKAILIVKGEKFIVTARDLYTEKHDIDAPFIVECILNQVLHDVINKTEGIIIRETASPVMAELYEYFVNLQRLKYEEELKAINKWKKLKYTVRDRIEKFTNKSIWSYLVPYDLALSIIIYVLHFHPLSADHLYRTFKIAEDLKKVYKSNGRWNVMRAFDLVKTKFMVNLFNTTNCFRNINIALKVEKIVTAKGYKLKPIKRKRVHIQEIDEVDLFNDIDQKDFEILLKLYKPKDFQPLAFRKKKKKVVSDSDDDEDENSDDYEDDDDDSADYNVDDDSDDND